jgi:hypothetical protein
MRRLTSITAPSVNFHPRVAVRSGGQPHMARGLLNGIVLSLAVWLAAGCLAFILR